MDSIRVSEKKKILLDIDKNVRKSSELIQQITLGFIEDDRNFIIANSEGKYIQSNTIVTRFIANNKLLLSLTNNLHSLLTFL